MKTANGSHRLDDDIDKHREVAALLAGRCCVAELAAASTKYICIQGEKTILAASDVEPFYSGHRRRLLSTRNSYNFIEMRKPRSFEPISS